MPLITSRRLVNNNVEYEIDIDFDDNAIMEDKVAFGFNARRRNVGEENWVNVRAGVRFNFAERTATLHIDDNIVGEIQLDLEIPTHMTTEEAWRIVERNFRPNEDNVGIPIEQIIQAVPAFDPVVGCILKATISTTVGQTLQCYNEIGERESMRERIRETIKCLGSNTFWMLGVATARAFRCMVMLGLG